MKKAKKRYLVGVDYGTEDRKILFRSILALRGLTPPAYLRSCIDDVINSVDKHALAKLYNEANGEKTDK